MTEILAVISLAFLWGFLASDFSYFNLTVGALLGLLLLGIVQRDERSFTRRLWAFLRYLLLFARELMVANVVIAMLALKPRPRFYPHIIAVPLTIKTDAAIALLSATITLLPGTVAIGVSEDKLKLYAHAIGSADILAARESVLRMERLILGFMS